MLSEQGPSLFPQCFQMHRSLSAQEVSQRREDHGRGASIGTGHLLPTTQGLLLTYLSHAPITIPWGFHSYCSSPVLPCWVSTDTWPALLTSRIPIAPPYPMWQKSTIFYLDTGKAVRVQELRKTALPVSE